MLIRDSGISVGVLRFEMLPLDIRFLVSCGWSLSPHPKVEKKIRHYFVINWSVELLPNGPSKHIPDIKGIWL